MSPRQLTILFLFIVSFFTAQQAEAQYKLKGTVYDSSRIFPVQYVSVISSSGRGTITNENGHYELDVSDKDSVWFSYLNKPTKKFSVLGIPNMSTFDIALQVNVPVLKEIKLRPRNYRLDSIENREEYAKVFNFRKPGISMVTPEYGGAAGFNLDELINAFRFKRTRNMLAFQRRLLAQEKETFVDHRFNKGLVRRLTGLVTDQEVDSFMRIYRPSYYFAEVAPDYEFQEYIKVCFDLYKQGLPPPPMFKDEEEENQ